MLSDRDRKMLHEVERQFMADDPKFAVSFQAYQQRLASRQRANALAARIASALALVLVFFMLVVGEVGYALTLAVATGLVWVVWRYRDDPSRALGHKNIH